MVGGREGGGESEMDEIGKLGGEGSERVTELQSHREREKFVRGGEEGKKKCTYPSSGGQGKKGQGTIQQTWACDDFL